MSVFGTHFVAGVAGTTQTAQQIASARDKREREVQRPGRKLRDTYDTHLKVLEEQDGTESAPRLVVDDQLQERSHEPTEDPALQPKKRLDVKA